jgi:integrase
MNNKFHFTKKALGSLSPLPQGTKQREWIDDVEPALRAIQYRDRISFAVRTCVNGQRRCETIGEYPYNSINGMRGIATEKRILAKRGGLHARDAMTFKQFCSDVFLPSTSQRLSDKGHKYRQMLRDFIYPVMAKLPLRKVSRKCAEQLQSDLILKGYSPAYADHVIKLVKQVLNCAVDHDYLLKSPVRGVKLFNPNNAGTRVLSHEESRQLFAVCKSEKTLVADFLSVLLFTPLRKSECAAIAIEHVSSDYKSILIAQNKSDRPYLIYVPDQLVEVIQRRIAVSHNRYLFPSHIKGREDKHIVDIRVSAEKLYKAAGIEGVGYHDFRRTCITNMIEVAGNHAASKASNHSNLAITSRYYQPRETVLADAFQKTAESVFPI